MRPDQVTAWISDARFHAFLEASGRDHDRAVALYNWNAEVSAAFLEVLCHLEILLRNAIDHQFPATAGDARLFGAPRRLDPGPVVSMASCLI